MRDLIEHLRNDQRDIADVMRAFQHFFATCESGNPPERAQLRTILEAAATVLVDRYVEKEEDLLLPELCRHGLSWQYGILGQVRGECLQCRCLRRELQYASQQRCRWNPEEVRRFVSVGREWSILWEHHIRSEQAELFPVLDARLSLREETELLLELEDVDEEYARMNNAPSMRRELEVFLHHHLYPQAPLARFES